MLLKVSAWNVNSLRVRLGYLLEWLSCHQPDIICLQETKLLDEEFPVDAVRQAGYEAVYTGQKAYNGVAILSKRKGSQMLTDIPGWVDPQRRIIGLTFDDIRVINLYVPNGESTTSEKFQYKLTWLDRIYDFLLAEIKKYPKLIVLGDFNIAPSTEDVYDPEEMQGQLLFSEPERNRFKKIIELGLSDCFRLHSQAEKSFTWWDYRMNSFKRNRGLRIDHILAAPALSKQCVQCFVDRAPRALERPSDHAPIVAVFEGA